MRMVLMARLRNSGGSVRSSSAGMEFIDMQTLVSYMVRPIRDRHMVAIMTSQHNNIQVGYYNMEVGYSYVKIALSHDSKSSTLSQDALALSTQQT
jgi:hypothetical protein